MPITLTSFFLPSKILRLAYSFDRCSQEGLIEEGGTSVSYCAEALSWWLSSGDSRNTYEKVKVTLSSTCLSSEPQRHFIHKESMNIHSTSISCVPIVNPSPSYFVSLWIQQFPLIRVRALRLLGWNLLKRLQLSAFVVSSTLHAI